MPLPGANFVGLPDLTGTLSGGTDPSETAEFQDLLATLQVALGEASDPGQVIQEQVPGTVSPIAGMAGVFASTLAESLGARGAAGATRGRIQQAEQNQQQAELRNLERQRQSLAQVKAQRIGVLKQISDAKLAAFEEAGIIRELEAELRKNMALLREEEKLRKERELEVQALRNKGGLERTQLITDLKRDQPPSPAQLLQQDKFINQVDEGLESLLSRKGMTEESEGFLGLGFGKSLLSKLPPGTRLTESGKREVQNRMARMARLSQTPVARETALETYLDTLRDDEGDIDFNTPDGLRFQRILRIAFPDSQEALQFMVASGFAPGQ